MNTLVLPQLGGLFRAAVTRAGYRPRLTDLGLDKDLDDLALETRQGSSAELLFHLEDAVQRELAKDSGEQWAQVLRWSWGRTREAIQGIVREVETTPIATDAGSEAVRAEFSVPMLAGLVGSVAKHFPGIDLDVWWRSPFAAWVKLAAAVGQLPEAEVVARLVAQFGRVVLRRGYGNHATLANKWQEALVRLAFTPCLQYQYAPGKNTSDIALALDAMEALFDGRADTFCLVTSDSDFAYLCRKLRERGATVHIVGEEKTPDALRNASDQFFEWTKPAAASGPTTNGATPAQRAVDTKPAAPKPEAAKPAPKRRPLMVVEAVKLMAADTAEGKVHLGPPRTIP